MGGKYSRQWWLTPPSRAWNHSSKTHKENCIHWRRKSSQAATKTVGITSPGKSVDIYIYTHIVGIFQQQIQTTVISKRYTWDGDSLCNISKVCHLKDTFSTETWSFIPMRGDSLEGTSWGEMAWLVFARYLRRLNMNWCFAELVGNGLAQKLISAEE